MSSETKFTPGPWRFAPILGEVTVAATCKALVDIDAWWLVDDDEQRDADAYLIAAAPDLYEALCILLAAYMTATCQHPDDEVRKVTIQVATAALSRARGEEPAGGAE